MISIAELVKKNSPTLVKVKDKNLPSLYYSKNGKPSTDSRDFISHACTLPTYRFVAFSATNHGEYNSVVVLNLDTKDTKAYYFGNDAVFEEVESDNPLVEKWKRYQIDQMENLLFHNWTIGADPEIFVEDKDGAHIPAFLFLGSKKKPDYTPATGGYSSNGGMPMYWDGFQAEFETRPGTCLEFLTDSVAAGLKGVYDAAKRRFPGARLSINSVVEIPPDMLSSAEEEHVAFGCMPSFNAYGLKVNMPPGREVPFRSTGGHIHFGLGKMTQEEAEPIVKTLDAILGVACVSLFANFDSRKRRSLYGLPGEYRLPPHGLEYRPLSNAWLTHPLIMNLVIDLARKCVMLSRRGMSYMWQATEEEVIDIMVRSDVEAAQKCLEKNKKLFIRLLRSSYMTYGQWATLADLEMFYGFFVNGLETAVKDPTDFVSNWYLHGTNGSWSSQARNKNCNVSRSMEDLRAGKKV